MPRLLPELIRRDTEQKHANMPSYFNDRIFLWYRNDLSLILNEGSILAHIQHVAYHFARTQKVEGLDCESRFSGSVTHLATHFNLPMPSTRKYLSYGF